MPNRVQGEPFFLVPDRVVKLFGRKIRGNGMWVYNVLAMHANRERACHLSVAKIVSETGLSKTQVYRTLKLLSDCRIISKRKDGHRAIACYRLVERTLFDGLSEPEISSDSPPAIPTGGNFHRI